MSNVSKLEGAPDRPFTFALAVAIDEAIEELATEKVTLIEIIGCLEFVKMKFYAKAFTQEDE